MQIGFGSKVATFPLDQLDLFCSSRTGLRLVLFLSRGPVAHKLPSGKTWMGLIVEALSSPSFSATEFSARLCTPSELQSIDGLRYAYPLAKGRPPKDPAPKGPKPKSVYAYRCVSVASDGSKVYRFHKKWNSVKDFIGHVRADKGVKAPTCALYTSCNTHHTAYGFLWRKEYLGEEITLPTAAKTPSRAVTANADTDTTTASFEADPLF